MQDHVKNIVAQVTRAHYNFIGEEGFDQIQEAVASGISFNGFIATAEGGSAFDWAHSAEILWQCVQVTSTVVGLYLNLKKLFGREPTKQELSAEVEKSLPTKQKLEPLVAAKVDSIVDSVLHTKP